MEIYLFSFSLAFITTFILTPSIKHLAHLSGAFDYPQPRRINDHPVPNLGGMAIYLGFLLSVFASLSIDQRLQGLLLGGTLILLTGLLDDYRGLSPRAKLVGQIAAASIAIMYGVRVDFITHPMGGIIYLERLAVPLTLFWIVGITNTINLIDGLDGLASGVAGIASLTLFVVALREGQFAIAVLSVTIAGSSLAFLRYNFNPAQIFMGDAGAMFIGFVLACISVLGALKSTAAITLIVPFLALGVPIFDTLFAIVRRHQRGKPIFQADRGHLHHRLLDLGLSHRNAVLVIYLISTILGVLAVGINGANPLQATVILSLTCIILFFGAQRLGILVIKRSFSEKGSGLDS